MYCCVLNNCCSDSFVFLVVFVILQMKTTLRMKITLLKMILILFSLEVLFFWPWKLKRSFFDDFIEIYLKEDLLADLLALNSEQNLTYLIPLVDYLRISENVVGFCLLYFVPVEDSRMDWDCLLRPKKS